MARAWCNFKAAAKTPALSIYNTQEASQAPTLTSYIVGSTSFNSLPLSFSSPLPYWWLSYCYATDSMSQLIHNGINYQERFKAQSCIRAYLCVNVWIFSDADEIKVFIGAGLAACLACLAAMFNTKPFTALTLMARWRAFVLDMNWRCLSTLSLERSHFLGQIQSMHRWTRFVSLTLSVLVSGRESVCSQEQLRSRRSQWISNRELSH